MASRGVNKVILLGRLGQDPDVRYRKNGDAVVNLSLATTEVWKDDRGQAQERTEWHRVVCFRGLAKVAAEWLRKGARVYIEGHLQTSSYEKNGEKRYSTQIVADELQPIDWPDDGGGPGSGRRPAGDEGSAPAGDGFDDDLPF